VYKADVFGNTGIALADQNLLISAEELRARLGAADLRVIDCRFSLLQADAGRESYLEGHIPAAVYADLDKDLAGPPGPGTGRHPLPDSAALTSTFSRLGIGSSTEVVVYDDCSGALASRAWWLLRWLGHAKVSLLDGGLARWNQLAYPLDDGDTTVTAAAFIARKRPGMVLHTEEIVASGDSCEALRLVDARDAARFRGESEPIDPIAGHIPGALNVPLSASLNPDGTWMRQEQLQALWRTVLGEDEKGPWSVMCGSGVTACHLVISGLLAGRSEPRLYVGSWSEWIRDSSRQVATSET
jgi:thiosulfate/3-mercaptopyruvate sulfurtransferase